MMCAKGTLIFVDFDVLVKKGYVWTLTWATGCAPDHTMFRSEYPGLLRSEQSCSWPTDWHAFKYRETGTLSSPWFYGGGHTSIIHPTHRVSECEDG